MDNILNDIAGMAEWDRLSRVEREQKIIAQMEAQYRARLLSMLQHIYTGDRVRDVSIRYEMDMSERTDQITEYPPMVERARTPGLPYDDSITHRSLTIGRNGSITEWEGTGFNPEGPPGTEGQTPPVFRDMSGLYGEMYDDDYTVSLNTGSRDMVAQLRNAVDRRLVRQASISMRAENLEAAETFVSEVMEKHNAYSASTVMEENSHHYSIRVPSTAYDVFLAEISGLGRILHRYERVEDVTLRYFDVEGRLATQRELLVTYQSYLGRARNIDEILSVERRIAELQREIDRSGRDLRDLSRNIEYSVVELRVLGPVAASAPFQGVTLAERIKGTFSGFGSFLSAMIIALISIVVYGIPIALLLALLIWILFGKIGLLKKLWRLAVGKKA